MTAVIIGSIGFLCCFLYDHNSIRLKKSFLHPFFSIGCFLIAVSTGLVIRSCWPRQGSSFFISAVFLTAAILFSSSHAETWRGNDHRRRSTPFKATFSLMVPGLNVLCISISFSMIIYLPVWLL